MATNQEIKILWDQGTAYDFFTSLYVLHFPDEFGLRGAWAAGVRSRLPSKARDFLEVIVGNFNPPKVGKIQPAMKHSPMIRFG